MAQLISKKLPASTLIEVIISMVIIMAVFVAGIAIFTKVTHAGFSYSKAEAQQHMQYIVQKSIVNADWEEQETEEDSISYKKTVKEYAPYKDLVLIEVRASQNGSEIGLLRQLAKKEQYEN